LSAGASPQTTLGELTALPRPLAGLGVGPPGKGKKGGESENEGGDGVPECPNPELASPSVIHSDFISVTSMSGDMCE